MKFAICNELFEDWPHDRVCAFLAQCGYEGVEIAPFTLGPRADQVPTESREYVRRCTEDYGLSVVGLHWLLARTEGLHLTCADEHVRASTAAYLAELARLCYDLGGRVLVFGSPQQRNLEPGITKQQGMKWAAEVFQSLTPVLDRYDLVLAVEPLSPRETNFLNTCAEAWELIEMIGHPRVKLHLDVKAMSTESTPIPALIRRWGRHAVHFHANDSNLSGPGFGDIDFVPIFDALLEIGYSGWVSVEVFDFRPGPEVIARRSLEYMKDCLRKLGAE